MTTLSVKDPTYTWTTIGRYVLLIVLAVVFVFPIIFMIV